MKRILTSSFILLAALGGCAEKKTFDVSGTVIFNGKPLPAGVVWFDPDSAKGNDSSQGFAYVKEGQFDSKEKGRGIRGGAYIIRVEGFDGKPWKESKLGLPLFTDYQEKRDVSIAAAKLEIEVKIQKKP